MAGLLALTLAACRGDAPDRDSSPSFDECDEAAQLELHVDADGDSYGAPDTVVACPGDGFVSNGTDCDDDDPAVHPGAKDLCDGRDDDCDGADGEPVAWYADADEDGFGDAATKTLECAAPAGFVANAEDCDDSAAAVHPGAVETCDDTIDDDCSGADLVCGSPFEGTYDLADADAIVSGSAHSLADAGRVLQSGDVTGDGIDDVFAGTLFAHHGSGGGWVVPGPLSGAVALADVGFDLAASDATLGAGRSIGLGDVNADGIGDVAFGCPYTTIGAQYIVFGPITSDGRIVDEYDAAIHSPNVEFDFFSHGSDLGDVDGDGTDDSVVAAWAGSAGGKSESGTLWVTFGPLTGDLDPDVDADAVVEGEHANANAGRVVHVVDDVDGDGLEDVVLNAHFDDTGGPNAGAVYVVYGPADISSLADAAILVGPESHSFTGQEFTSGDYDGDGYGEVTALVSGSEKGVYVARGPLADSTDLAAADAILEGEFELDALGSGLGSGDLDGDGNDDLLVGAPYHDAQTGVAYLVPDPPSGTSTITDVAIATFEGETSGTYAGQAMAVGDLNGDGENDLLVGAPGLLGSGGIYVEYAEP